MPTAASARHDDAVIRAAREVFAEHGMAAPISEVAQRAGVGVASIYRRYPSKTELVEQVRIAAFRLVIDEAEAARAEEQDPWQALSRFMHRCLREGSGIGTVLPQPEAQHPRSVVFRDLQQRVAEVIEALVEDAKLAGELRADVDWPDVLLLFKHLNPSLPTSEPRRAELRARYLGLVLDGMRAEGAPLRGPAPDTAEWRALCDGRTA
ncbi:TetR/AcrR family transcriptional regulator [Saccharopolyspora rhizosphaerae]|uniref:TetR/AcrR family transcriptional regulator n=1 Tax=Saccharopolyspora rhizosphaerae TaxID=2492662 RepID=A0A426JK97_9PSEU|nr:TetR/AcrR family transcriptional regulator [Saccharopolyspora rhizosphaerae]RRO13627.1 TetR/AcrR family transcriptional regulator [Saccharopolyspora rhizosphaerae]